MVVRVKIGSSVWKDVVAIRVKTAANTWKDVIAGRVKTAINTWVDWFSTGTQIAEKVTISQSTNSTTKLVTLTGTNYHWSPAPTSLFYEFKKVGVGTIASGTATNPSLGSSNAYTTTISASSGIISPNEANEFVFSITATYSGPDTVSESTSTVVYGPTDITLTATSSSSTAIDLEWTTSNYANAYLIYINPNDSVFIFDSLSTTTSKTITGLVPGAPYSFYVVPITGTTTSNPGYYGNNSNVESVNTFNGDALVPTFGTNTSTATGYTGSVTNYNASWTWDISTSAGSVTWGTVSGSTRPFTVSGLGVSSPATVTVTTSRTGYNNGSNSTTYSSAAGSARVPTFGTVTRTSTGFNSSITNYDANWSWSTPTAEDGTLYETSTNTPTGTFTWGTVSGSTRTFSVTGAPPGTSITAVITASRTGYTPGTASISGVSLTLNARVPTFGPYTPTATGFTCYVNNYDANWTWTLNGIERGTFTWGTPSGSNYPFTVTGMSRGQNSAVGIRSSRAGYDDGVGSIIGYSLDPEYTITYSGNGNTGGSTASTTGYIPLTVASNGFTKTNYTFRSWNTAYQGTGTVYAPGSTYNTYANITLYAIWDIIQYTVTWDASGGSVSPSSSVVNSGSSVTAPTPTRSGYTFNGWYNAVAGGSLIVNAGSSYSPTASITLYARWTANVYTITYNANGGSVTPSSVDVNQGSSISLPTPSRSGYSFNGWYTASSGGTYVGGAGSTYTPTANITLYAQWTAIVAGSITVSSISASKTATRQITGTWSSVRSGTSTTFYWWNTRVRNTATSAVATHTLFSETPRSDVFTSLTGTSYRFGIQGVIYDNSYSVFRYSIGTTDGGSYAENATNINPQ